jgi:4-amino-4-deoxy-L-arabinose transferase-like glycosyltransferase
MFGGTKLVVSLGCKDGGLRELGSVSRKFQVRKAIPASGSVKSVYLPAGGVRNLGEQRAETPRGRRKYNAGLTNPDRRSTPLWLFALVVVLRLLFLNQPLQGDDVNYLKGGEHALIEPLHPTHAEYAFRGKVVSMMGHPHPPLDAWVLGILLAVFGDVHEAKFHAIYIVFSLLAVWAAWHLAARFTPRPAWAALLVAVTPAFVVNGGSLESDVPFVAFWLASIALFVRGVDEDSPRWLAWSAVVQVAAAMAAFQAMVLVPVLTAYLWWAGRGRERRVQRLAWAVVLVTPAVIGAWQGYERVTSGALPAAVLGGYFESYGLQKLARKLENAGALTAHLGWVISPVLAAAAFGWRRRRMALIAAAGGLALAWVDPNPLFWASFAVGLLVVLGCARIACGRDGEAADPGERFLAVWILLFFGFALAVFFAGAARYLLPLVLPVAILATRRVSDRRWLAAGVAINLTLSLGLAWVNYKQWSIYRAFAAQVMEMAGGGSRVWIDSEWGLRYYLESAGALPYLLGQEVRPGDWIVSSELGGYAPKLATGGGRPVEAAALEVRSRVPLRLIAINSRSGYSTASLGLRPFDISSQPIDRVRAVHIVAAQPTLAVLPMNSPEAARHLVSGVYDLEDNAWRWMGGQAVVMLKAPPRGAGDARVAVDFYIPAAVPGRRVTVSVDGVEAVARTYPQAGAYRLEGPVKVSGESAMVTIGIDKTFAPPGDARQLGMILRAVALE